MCDCKYVEKADKRHSGVGKEAQIISGEVYRHLGIADHVLRDRYVAPPAGGRMWASSNSRGEIAVRAKAKARHARLAVGITSNSGISEEALLKLMERMIQ